MSSNIIMNYDRQMLFQCEKINCEWNVTKARWHRNKQAKKRCWSNNSYDYPALRYFRDTFVELFKCSVHLFGIVVVHHHPLCRRWSHRFVLRRNHNQLTMRMLISFYFFSIFSFIRHQIIVKIRSHFEAVPHSHTCTCTIAHYIYIVFN